MIRRSVLFLVVCMLLGTGFVQAQDMTWTVWVYDPETGTVILFGSDGRTILDFDVTMPDGYDRFPDRVSVAPDGSVIAYVAGYSATGEQQIVVTEWLGADIRGAYDLGRSNTMPVTMAFRETEDTPTVSAESYDWTWGLNRDALDDPDRERMLAFAYRPEQGGWQIVIYDATGDTVVSRLDAADPVVVETGIPGDAVIGVQRFFDDAVMFTVESADNPAPHPAYVWRTGDQTIDPTPAYGLLPPAVDTLPTTGETLMAVGDTTYAYDPQRDRLFPFYHDPGETLFMPTLIQHGTRVLVAYGIEGTPRFLRVLNRDGTVAADGLGPPGEIIDVIGTPDGVVFVTSIGGSTYVGALTTDTDPIEPGGPIFWCVEGQRALHLAFVHTGIIMPDVFEPLTEIPAPPLDEPPSRPYDDDLLPDGV